MDFRFGYIVITSAVLVPGKPIHGNALCLQSLEVYVDVNQWRIVLITAIPKDIDRICYNPVFMSVCKYQRWLNDGCKL